jgi:hypothetical protein
MSGCPTRCGHAPKNVYEAKDDRLAQCYRRAVIHSMLIEGLNAKEIAAARGLTGAGWPLYFSRRYFECLRTLAEAFGFVSDAVT